MITQPDAPNAPTKSATPLERSIYEYQLKADQFHNKAINAKSAGKEEKERLRKEWVEARDYLDNLRMRIDSMAAMEDGLAQYRNEFGILDSEQCLAKMRAEKHHPTKKLRKI